MGILWGGLLGFSSYKTPADNYKWLYTTSWFHRILMTISAHLLLLEQMTFFKSLSTQPIDKKGSKWADTKKNLKICKYY